MHKSQVHGFKKHIIQSPHQLHLLRVTLMFAKKYVKVTVFAIIHRFWIYCSVMEKEYTSLIITVFTLKNHARQEVYLDIKTHHKRI